MIYSGIYIQEHSPKWNFNIVLLKVIIFSIVLNAMKNLPLTRWIHFAVVAKKKIYPSLTHNWLLGIRGILQFIIKYLIFKFVNLFIYIACLLLYYFIAIIYILIYVYLFCLLGFGIILCLV